MFKSFLIIFNPNAGKGFGEYYSNQLHIELQKKGATSVRLFKSESEESFNEFLTTLKQDEKDLDCAIVIGGDGTLSSVINGFYKNNIETALVSFGHGTCNDFISDIKTPKSVKKFVANLQRSNIRKIDIIGVNDKYGINVVSGGCFTSSATTYNAKAKKAFGKLSYYATAFVSLFKLKPQRVSINVDGREYREDIYLFLIINSRRAGGIKHLSATSTIDDGKFDLIMFKKCGFWKRFGIFCSILFGQIRHNKNIIVDSGINFSAKPIHNVTDAFRFSDLDGNKGPNYPINVNVIKQKFNYVLPQKYITKQAKEQVKIKNKIEKTQRKANLKAEKKFEKETKFVLKNKNKKRK